jgi:hypothetical protein
VTIFAALILVGLGVALAEVYNHRIRMAEMRIRALHGEPGTLPHVALRMRSMDRGGLPHVGAPQPGQGPQLPPWFVEDFRRNGQVAARINKGKWERV